MADASALRLLLLLWTANDASQKRRLDEGGAAMNPALRALLGGIIDYAGLFPPAQLPLEEAIRNYARYRTEPESWMLGRFVIPATRLKELAELGKELFR